MARVRLKPTTRKLLANSAHVRFLHPKNSGDPKVDRERYRQARLLKLFRKSPDYRTKMKTILSR